MLVYVSFFICPPSKQEESKCVNLRQTVLVCQGLVSLPDPHVRSLDMVTWPCRCQTDPPKSVSTEIRTWQGCGETKNCITPMDARRGRWFNFKGMKMVWGIISQFSYIGSSYPQLYLLIISFSKAFPDIYLLLISSLIFLITSFFCYIHCLSSRLQEKNCVRRCLSSSSQQF